ncbi:MAG TPA: uroporphyrin-III C-methyltransferase, partial [Archaeoglobus veneficus]|nr:uroporphyrin-III C-methyltransferase [Archaeoglobus veneficus]
TIVILMGRDTLADICNKLIEAGRDPSTPVAVIEKGTTREQKVIVGNLKNIVKKVREAKIKGATLIVVGEVVRFSNILNGRPQKI